MSVRFIILLVVSSLFLSSCGKIMMGLFGLRNPKEYSEEEVLKEARKQKIPKNDVYILDTSFNQFLSNSDTSKKVWKMYNNHGQPAQALYYNREGELESFHITCYAHGYRSKWNYYGAFDQFPPETAAPVDTLMSLEDQIKFIKPLSIGNMPVLDEVDYVVIVYFNRLTRARNRRLVKQVKKNAKLCGDQKLKIIYVNTDNFWFHCLDVDFSEI